MDRDVLEIQKLYPRIYLACHTDHMKAASSEHGLSARDATILAHLSDNGLTSPSRLAKQLNVAKTTVSEALSKLMGLGYVTSQFERDDEDKKRLSLTDAGLIALSKSSVLDYDKLMRVIMRLTPTERAKVIEGLTLLSEAALGQEMDLSDHHRFEPDGRSEH